MPIHRRESGNAVKVTPHLFTGEANVYLNDGGSAIPLHLALQVFEGYEHNDLAGYYNEIHTGDFDAFDIQQNIVRSGNYALKILHSINESNRIFADTSLIDTPQAGDSFRIWFYHDGSINDDRHLIFDFALDDVAQPMVEDHGGYQIQIIQDYVNLNIWQPDGTHVGGKAYEGFDPDALPNNQWNYLDVHWNNSKGVTTSDSQIGWELYNGQSGDRVATDIAKNEDRYPSRDGYYHKSLTGSEIDTYVDDLQYI